jgi:hypothetical protein
MKNTLGKKENIFLCGPNPSHRLTHEAKPARSRFPSLPSLSSGPEVLVEPTYRPHPPLPGAHLSWDFPRNSPARACAAHRRQCAATAHPSVHLGAYHRHCRATPPGCMPSGRLVPSRSRAVASRCCSARLLSCPVRHHGARGQAAQ